jgi:type IV pilus assembly protein PilY1
MTVTRKCICTSVAVVVFLLLASVGAGTAQAQPGVCEYPLFIQQQSTQANVLFVFDNSGSMNEAMFHDDFDPDVTYSGSFNSSSTYYVSSSGTYKPRDFNNHWAASPSAYLVASDHGESGRYIGNYLNWIYFNATAEQRASIPRVTRIQVAKPAVADIVENTDNIRFGIMKFSYDSGGVLAAPLGSTKADVLTKLDAIAGTTWTPTAETLVDVADYLKQSGSGCPIQYWCQRTFIVVVTDGFPTMDRDIPSYIGDYDHDGKDPGNCASIGAPYTEDNYCSHYMDDVAKYLHDVDLRSDLKEQQNAITYTIGFDIDAGIYLSAYNADQLRATLQNVMNDIISRVSSGSAVAVVSQETSETDRLFRAKFVPTTWRGYLEAFALPYEEGDNPIWEAGQILQNRNPETRQIFTVLDGQRVDFNADYADIFQPYLNVSTTDSAATIIEYIRGTDVEGARQRMGWKLGDIVDSSPVVVGGPNHFYDYLDYNEFRMNYQDREQVIYIGSNDGMLHCFSASNGQEKWAYIPNEVLSKLKYLADPEYCHNFFVNLTPKVVDAYVNGQWRTILIGGEREGGDSYFALDITYPDYPTPMWEVSIPELNHSWTKPAVARVERLNKFVVFMSSGPDETNGCAYLFALDLYDGSVIWSDLLSTISGTNMATAPVTIDIDFDDYDDLLYLADLGGNIWRVDLRGNSWETSLLFQTNQPISAEPILTMDLEGYVHLYFGTGEYMVPADVDDTSQQTFYSVIDDHSTSTLGRSNLVDQTYSINPIPATKKGWFVDLVMAPGERIVKPDALVSGVVYFTSFQPTDEVCTAGGRSWLYAVDYLDASAPDNKDGSENDTTEDRVESLGDGFTSEPVIDIVNENVIVQSSDTKISVVQTKTAIRHLIVRSWRPLYQ